MNISRSRRYAAPLLLLGIALVVGGTRTAPGWATSPREIKVNRGTNIAATVSPDRSKIAYSSDNAVFGSNYTVRVLDLATRTSTTVASDATLDDFEPTWSPDGKTIAIVNGTGANGTSIQAVPAAGGARTALVMAPTGQGLHSPAYSPGGTQIAYLQFGTNSNVNHSP